MPKPDPAVEKVRKAVEGSRRRIDELMAEVEAELKMRGVRVPAIMDPPPWLPDLPVALRLALAEHCQRTGERPSDVIADALALHLDDLEGACLCEVPA